MIIEHLERRKGADRLDALVEFLQLSGGSSPMEAAKDNFPCWDDWMLYDAVMLGRRRKLIESLRAPDNARKRVLRLASSVEQPMRSQPKPTHNLAARI